MMPAVAPMALVDHALAYAARGFEIFPVKEQTKAPYTEHGMKEATSNPDQIRLWWKHHPLALIGCRIPEHLVVLDIDPRHGGDETWNELERAYAPITYGRRHHSGRNDGGFHIWAKRPDGKLQARPLHEWARRNKVGRPAGKRSWTSGIDILHYNHRYTILPPSPHPDTGRPYVWDVQDEPMELPGYVVDLITQKSTPAPQPIRVVRDSDSIADWFTATHSWHDVLPSAGWQLVEGDGDSDGSKWRHPNASAESSASIRHGCLFVYSDNTDFDVTEEGDPHGLTKFKAWSVLEHDDSMSNAARAAREEKDGPPIQAPTLVAFDPSVPWPDPQPFGDTPSCPEFPIEALPIWIRDHVRQVADEFQFPCDLPAMLAITALSICCARRAEVVVQGTWREPLNTYLATAMPPGAGKSPAVRAMLGCLDRWEAQLIERTAPQRDEAETKRAILEKSKTKAINAGEMAQAMVCADEIRALPELATPRLMADDATPEKLTEMLYEQGGRMALVSTEGGVFGLMTGRYSDKANLNVYLQAWSSDPIRVDRIGRKSSIVLNPALTVGLTVQPTVIAALAETPELAGRGLTARIMYSFPPSNVGYRDMGQAPAIDVGVADEYERQLVKLAERMESSVRETPVFLDTEARAVYVGWRQEMEDRCRPGGDLHHMQEWVTKLGSTVARLAGLMTLADGCTTVDVDAMERSVTIGRYWEAHARVAYGMWGDSDPDASRATLVLDWLSETATERFTARDLCRRFRQFTAVDAMAAVQLLVDNSWVRSVDGLPLVAGRRGVPSPELTTHPEMSRFRNNHVVMSSMSPKQPNSLTSSSSVFTEGQGTRDMDDMDDNPPKNSRSSEPVDNQPEHDPDSPFG